MVVDRLPGAIFYTSRAYYLHWIINFQKAWYVVPYKAGGWHHRKKYYGDTRHLTRLSGPVSLLRIKHKLTVAIRSIS